MQSKYLVNLIKIVDHVSNTRVSLAHSNSCTLVSENYKNLELSMCYRIACKECVFSFKPDYQSHILEVKNVLEKN